MQKLSGNKTKDYLVPSHSSAGSAVYQLECKAANPAAKLLGENQWMPTSFLNQVICLLAYRRVFVLMFSIAFSREMFPLK